MKKTAVPVKRLARARIIELNGPAERVELLLLIFMAPLWGIVFPLIGMTQMASAVGVTLLAASLFCFLHFLHLYNSRFSFEESGVRLPGVDHRLLPYTSLKRIYLETQSPLELAVEFIPNNGRFSKKSPSDQLIPQVFETQHLTEESARQLWALFASHLRSCTISLDVRDKLVNWRTQASKIDTGKTLIGSTVASEDAAPKMSLAGDDYSGRSSHIARDLSMLVELKPFDPLKVVGQYMVSYSDTFRKTWLSCWLVVAAVAYPVTIAGLVVSTIQQRDQIAQHAIYQPQNTPNLYESFSTSLGQTASQLTDISKESLMTLFGNHIGAIGLFVLLYLAIYKFMRHLNDPDSMYIDYMGITTQKRTAAGVLPKEHRSWKTIDEIKLVRPHERSNSSRWSIVFECNQDKEKVEIPFKAFSSDRVRQQFIECLDTWGRNIKTDPHLLEALAPRNQTSYTELWLSALSEAPKIDELTPHSIGLRLQSRAYEIERQLASGGQGVAYLARKIKTTVAPPTDLEEKLDQRPEEAPAQVQDQDPANVQNKVQDQVPEQVPDQTTEQDEEEGTNQVVLKETVLPIYVDDRARAKALARFERDAKLLASLDHPLIVRLEDFFVENNRAYLALEYIPGKTLKEKVEADGPLPDKEVRRLALMMVDILEYLHERTPPVVHRDFTPDNLMLTNDGKIKLIDFDVALEQSSFSQTNATIVGKQAYIPLEQFRGKPCPQSDIYALGATLSYLLTGDEPAALQSSHPKVSQPEVSEQLDQVIGQCTALDLPERVDSAKSLRKLLLGGGSEVGDVSEIGEIGELGDVSELGEPGDASEIGEPGDLSEVDDAGETGAENPSEDLDTQPVNLKLVVASEQAHDTTDPEPLPADVTLIVVEGA